MIMAQLIEALRSTAAEWRASNQEHRGGVGHGRINMLGRYSFSVPEAGALRALSKGGVA
nr:hypothetical protein [Pseudomonas syringae group genomosp. 3]